MIITFFIMGCIVTFTGVWHFDAQRNIWYKLAAVPVLAIGVGMMVAAIAWRAA